MYLPRLHHRLFTLCAFMLAAATGCGAQPGPSALQPPYTTVPFTVVGYLQGQGHAVHTADAGHAGGAALAVAIALPGSGYGVLAKRHRWVPEDVTSFEVSLQTGVTDEAGNTSFPATPGDPAVSIPPTGQGPSHAGFTNLKPNMQYQVTIKVMGKKNRNAEIEHINQQHPIQIPFDFREDENHDIEDSPSKSVTVILDGVRFNGTANVTIDSVQPADWKGPQEAPAPVEQAAASDAVSP